MLNSNESITLKSTLRQNFPDFLSPSLEREKLSVPPRSPPWIQWLDLMGHCFSFTRSQAHLYPPVAISRLGGNNFQGLVMRVLLESNGLWRTSPRVKSSRAGDAWCLTFKRFRCKPFSAPPPRLFRRFVCNVKVYISSQRRDGIVPTDPKKVSRDGPIEDFCLTASAKGSGTNFSEEIIDIIEAGKNGKAYTISIISSEGSESFYRKQLDLRLLAAE
jgi:hypothetical protein